MRRDEFNERMAGELIEADGPSGRYLAFVPAPLPPDLSFSMELVKALSEADQALGELQGIGRMLPNPHLLIRPFLRREAVSSSRIEGTVTNLEQLFLFEADPLEDESAEDRREVVNYVLALEYALERLKTLPVSLRLIREAHERLMSGVRGESKRPGEFRDRQNMIGQWGQSLEEVRFVPPPVAEMHQALDALEKFMAHPTGIPVLVEIALIHYQFETIHPFLDGNGRLGRLLISLLLCERGCLTQPLLYLSTFFERNREEYTDLLLAVSRAGNWSAWIHFFLRGVALQSKMAVRRCNQMLDLRKEYRSRVHKLGSSVYLTQLIDHLFERPAITITRVAEALGISFNAAKANVEKLEQAGILEEVTGKPRDRAYLAVQIVDILNEPEDAP